MIFSLSKIRYYHPVNPRKQWEKKFGFATESPGFSKVPTPKGIPVLKYGAYH
jgi:hypothetical protein